MYSYNHVIVKSLIYASVFAYIHLSFDWAENFNKLKGALSCTTLLHFIWVTPPISYHLYFCKDCVHLFDKLL